MDSVQVLEEHPSSQFHILGWVTLEDQGHLVHAEICENGTASGQSLDFIHPGPFPTADDAKQGVIGFARNGPYHVTWIEPAYWIGESTTGA